MDNWAHPPPLPPALLLVSPVTQPGHSGYVCLLIQLSVCPLVYPEHTAESSPAYQVRLAFWQILVLEQELIYLPASAASVYPGLHPAQQEQSTLPESCRSFILAASRSMGSHIHIFVSRQFLIITAHHTAISMVLAQPPPISSWSSPF